VVLIHGGPGAVGETAPVGRALAGRFGVLEPALTARSLDGQVEQLAEAVVDRADGSACLVGFSFGAWLACLLAARRPDLARRVVLIGSGPFETRDAENITAVRLARLDPADRREAQSLLEALNRNAASDEDLGRLGRLLAGADAYDSLPESDPPPPPRLDVFQKVWPEAAAWRSDGRLLSAASRIQCPVAAIHGDHDPHPAEGVRRPLAAVVADFRFHLIPQCGHKPWRERRARRSFFHLLEAELFQALPASRG
jgi:pimeloyl-ACP methyl ester carboxylesterase